MFQTLLFFVSIAWICVHDRCVFAKLTEQERVEQWYARGNTWPPQWLESQDDSEAYKRHMNAREAEIMQLKGGDERWENWMQFVQARMLPRFTEQGFDVVKTPPHLHEKLYKAVMDGVNDWDNLRTESQVGDSIYGAQLPKFVDLGDIAWQVLNDPMMREMHEAWSGGHELVGTSAYGVRLYLNGSAMVMHNDKPHTHVISSIVHIAHEYHDDSEPWTIEIEDHDGKLHSVPLEEGEMLFYESAKCLHGRMTPLRGKYFGSIFLHYKPVDPQVWSYEVGDVIANVPPHWRDGVSEDHGSRWAGQAITVDSMVVYGAPPRIDNYVRTAPKEYGSEEDPYDDYRDERKPAGVRESFPHSEL